ncbi:MAG: proteasome assembly chaperone family protein [DPANN group archaeon]|nr:proteasome assembly chaperone family protein [DPANN group archaeon]
MMKIELNEKPQKATIIEGFPGFGFVSTIAIEYLVDHLKLKQIGRIWSPELAPMAIVHGKRVIQPIDILYNEKYNLVILEAIAGVSNIEWEVADAIIFLYKKLNAKEIISIEGIGSPESEKDESDAYFFSNDDARGKMLQSAGAFPLKDGIILGVSGALLDKLDKEIKASFIFAEAQGKLPDNRAAAKIIQVLDKYIGLDIDYAPLLKRAAEIEDKLKGLLEQARQAVEMQKQKGETTQYIG